MKSVRHAIIYFAFAIELTAQQPFPLETISITGTKYSEPLVLKLTGLQIGQPSGEAVFSETCKRLQATGLFTKAEYQYSPGPSRIGYALVLHLQDDPGLLEAEIDIPDVDEAELWKWMSANVPIVDRRVAGNDMALSFYARAIERYLSGAGRKQEVATQMTGSFGSAESMKVLFQPKNLPKIGSLKFEGASGLSANTLDQLLSGVALKSEYTPRRFRQLLEQNLRRAYEERGFLSVNFVEIKTAEISAGTVAVTTVIQEGKPYQLAGVEIKGNNLDVERLLKAAKFKIGHLANWKEIGNSISDMERPFRREGFVKIHSNPRRTLHDAEGTVDLLVLIELGPRFTFGTVGITGLDPAGEAKARSLWRLTSGQPMNQEYPDEFLKSLTGHKEFAGVKGFGTQLKMRKGEQVVDVVIAFH
jgi:outer membrane protein assembly factor BamA